MPIDTGGPYLSMAVLCEKVLQEKDGVMSVIRMVDRVILSPGPGAPEEMPPTLLQISAAIVFKSGVVNSQMKMRLTMTSPSGEETDIGSLPLLFEGNDRGVNIVMNLNIQAKEQGLYWLGVYLEDQLFTRVPLRIIYQMIGVGSAANL